ncbi:hypothetical protein SAMN00120144_0630 [Hymenobacter roseosalivarius DSM 11622]|uniref:Uncharacterized protein n=1 Tax=Hymenobacter roseosalivarius DSM 11622 TaxID=645990 RepID=A0A1W1VCH9_9BACT|nr:hypothetical protein [Hymenobacter roseosalivarius]SMB91078.1 hypothetical protein SAMN00120144_0630 [Hymenobacter roseosalivarius DSM 11622]
MAPDSTTLRLTYGADNPELRKLMSRVLQIEQQRLSIHDSRLAGKQFHLTFQEYRNGVPSPEKELVANGSRLTRFDSTGHFSLEVFSRQVSEAKVENRFLFAAGMTVKAFDVVPQKGDLYSLRADIRPFRQVRGAAGGPADNPITEARLPLGVKVPLLVYTLPYDGGDYLQWCTVAQSQVPVGEWYKRFRIPHFVVYSLRIE